MWLAATAVAVAAATLGALGLLAHLERSRAGSVIAFDGLWIVAALVAVNVCWRRTKWGGRS